MSTPLPTRFDNVSVACAANVYFEGKVVSHTIHFADGSRKTLGVITPGAYSFNTGAPERMDIVEGRCRARLKGQNEWTAYSANAGFDVPGNSSFEIAVDEGFCHYICSFR